MSITGLHSNPSEKIYKKSFHRRNDSDELDVFEASRYFSGYNEPTTTTATPTAKTTPPPPTTKTTPPPPTTKTTPPPPTTKTTTATTKTTFTEKYLMKEKRANWRSGGRVSLDMPMRNILPNHQLQSHHMVNDQKQSKEKKYKQPNSPGGKLASFLNSLFNQSSSKKKKSKSTQSMKDEEENPSSGRRKRRSSISHFRISSTTNDSKSLYSSSSSGFRTPPPSILRSIASSKSDDVFDGKREKDLAWLDEKLKYSNGFSEKYKNLGNNSNNNISFSAKERNWVSKCKTEDKEFKRFNKVDDGEDSDSSSDLFELQNYDLGCYSSGLPVYETTNMDHIKRGTPISNAQL